MSDYDLYSRTSTASVGYDNFYAGDERRLEKKSYNSYEKQLKKESGRYASNVADQDKSIRKWGGTPEAEAKLKYSGLSSNDAWCRQKLRNTYNSSNLSRSEKDKQYDTTLASYRQVQDQYANSVTSHLYAQR